MARRLIAWASLIASVIGVLLFGSIVAAIGDWVEGRELRTIAPWAIPGLVLGVVSSLTAARALLLGKGYQGAALLALIFTVSVASIFLVNPSIAPPVP